MNSMIQHELVIGVPNIDIEKKICGSCLLGKQARQSFPKETPYRASEILELIYGDLCGPITPATSAGNKYIFVLIDDHSRYYGQFYSKTKIMPSTNSKTSKASEARDKNADSNIQNRSTR